MPNEMDRGEPTDEYVDAVKDAVEDRADFSDDVAELLATNCWRHDWPFEKSYFDSEVLNFGEDDSATLDSYIETISAYQEAQEFEEEDDDDDYDDMDEMDFSEGGIMLDSAIPSALGLPVTASTPDVVRAIEALRASSFSEEERETLASLQREQRISYYTEQVASLDVIPGTSREKAEKLTDLEFAVTPYEAESRLNEWKAYAANAEQAGVTQSLLRAHSEGGTVNDSGPVQGKISEYAEDMGVDFNTALSQMAITDASIVSDYRQEITG